jgi:hypothetical protein
MEVNSIDKIKQIRCFKNRKFLWSLYLMHIKNKQPIIKSIIEWQGNLFLKEKSVVFSCNYDKKYLEKKLTQSSGGKKFFKTLIGLNSKFKVRISENIIVIYQNQSILCLKIYNFVGHLLSETDKTYIIGRYQMTFFCKFLALLWINLFFLSFILLFFLFATNSLLSIINKSYLIFAKRAIIIFFLSLGPFLMGCALFRFLSFFNSIKPLIKYLSKNGIKEDHTFLNNVV